MINFYLTYIYIYTYNHLKGGKVQVLRVMVNSHHHHAAGRVGENLRVTARSLDGTIEALEGENILAVQYHPEMLHDVEFFRKYFEA